MALYAFDGTWNEDKEDPAQDTNVVKFRDAYDGGVVYISGPGTRFGLLGQIIGGAFGAGGRSRLDKACKRLKANFASDKVIDIIGFSRGAAIALGFANRIHKKGVMDTAAGKKVFPKIRFLGLWDTVASFGLAKNFLWFKFQEINVDWDLDVPPNVEHCYHALAIDERRETFRPTRTPGPAGYEVWFRGHHSDVGGGNSNVQRNGISLRWMMKKAKAVSVPIRDGAIPAAVPGEAGSALKEPGFDPLKDPPRVLGAKTRIHYTVPKCTLPCPAVISGDAVVETEADETKV